MHVWVYVHELIMDSYEASMSWDGTKTSRILEKEQLVDDHSPEELLVDISHVHNGMTSI
jgi:hypothetical protein